MHVQDPVVRAGAARPEAAQLNPFVDGWVEFPARHAGLVGADSTVKGAATPNIIS